MLYDYIKQHYKEAEPIFFSELERGSITKSALNQQYVYVLQMLELLKNLDAYLDYSYVRGKGEVC